MAAGVVAPVDRAHALAIELEAAHQVGGCTLAFHQAAATRFHLADEAVAGFFHDISAALEQAQVLWADLLAPLGVLHRAPEAFPLFNGLVVDHQAVAALLHPQHPDPVGAAWIKRVALLQQQGAWGQLGQGPELHQDVGEEGWVFEGLMLVAETGAQLAQQAGGGAGHGRILWAVALWQRCDCGKRRTQQLGPIQVCAKRPSGRH